MKVKSAQTSYSNVAGVREPDGLDSQMQSAEPSARPWRTSEMTEHGRNIRSIEDSTGGVVAACFSQPVSIETEKKRDANAALIVKAVNSFDALVLALRRLVNFVDSFPPSTDPNVAAEEVKYIQESRDVLASLESTILSRRLEAGR